MSHCQRDGFAKFVGLYLEELEVRQVPEFTTEMMIECMEPPPDMPRPDDAKDADEEEKKKPLIVEVQFEKRGKPQSGDVKFLTDTFREREDAYLEGILNVQFRGVQVASDKDRGVMRDHTAGATPEEYYIFTVWVTFGQKPEAEATAPEDAPKEP